MELLTRLNAERGITILLVTHEDDVATYARRSDPRARRTHRLGSLEKLKPCWEMPSTSPFGRFARNLMRAFLTVLGVIIGVAAVITMVTLGQGTTQAVKNQISSLGSNLGDGAPRHGIRAAVILGGRAEFHGVRRGSTAGSGFRHCRDCPGDQQQPEHDLPAKRPLHQHHRHDSAILLDQQLDPRERPVLRRDGSANRRRRMRDRRHGEN